ARQGVRELLLIAQDSTYYGLDLYGKRVLSDLLKRLSDVAGIEWIRLHYAFPSGFPIDVLETMAERSNICKYLDIPLQHGSTRMLTLMRRGITRQKTEELLSRIRSTVPGIAIRTTLITGHPGEREEDFEEMIAFIREQQFEGLGVFTYSHEDGTHSGAMTDGVREKGKEERGARVMGEQQEISLRHNHARIGAVDRVIVDRIESSTAFGRTQYDSPDVDNEVIIRDAVGLHPGEFVQVRITDASEFDLVGTLC